MIFNDSAPDRTKSLPRRAFFSCCRVQASGASRSYKCSEIEKKEREEKREEIERRRNETMAARPSLRYRRLPCSADTCHLMMNEGTVDSPALGGGYGVGRWPAHAR